jgi:NAD(P)-dependent dehydrogenase (short-subunit alcohol dehydrogenase family)
VADQLHAIGRAVSGLSQPTRALDSIGERFVHAQGVALGPGHCKRLITQCAADVGDIGVHDPTPVHQLALAAGFPQRRGRPQTVIPLVLDVTDDASIQAAAQAAPDISILVNNAGILLRSNVLTSPLDDIQTELDANLFGIIRSRASAPALAKSVKR